MIGERAVILVIFKYWVDFNICPLEFRSTKMGYLLCGCRLLPLPLAGYHAGTPS